MIFLLSGLKYHDTTIRTRTSNAGNVAVMGSPTTICENIAPDMIKKNPA
jgi:hypothetical protein